MIIAVLTACACIITMLALPDFSSVTTFTDEYDHFCITDFYERAAAHSGVADLDSVITIISIDNCTHDEIAEVLDLTADCMPAAIGLDLLFYTLDNDHALKASLRNASPMLVLPVNVGEPLPSQAFINPDSLPLARYGRADLAQEHRGNPIRHYYLSVDSMPSFVAQTTSVAGYSIAERHAAEPLRYGSREFIIIDAKSMLDDMEIPAEDIYGKIVLIGTTHDINDIHYTPIDNDMPGVLIHAYALATLISNRPVRSLPPAVLYAIAFLFTAATIWLCMRVDERPYSNLVSRIIPLFIILIFIYISYHIYNRYSVYIDFTIVLTMTAAGILAYDLYTGIPAVVKAMHRRVSHN